MAICMKLRKHIHHGVHKRANAIWNEFLSCSALREASAILEQIPASSSMCLMMHTLDDAYSCRTQGSDALSALLPYAISACC